jgi:peptidoglycan L-alanyl-D-glutamate endopeptidase CwlK
LSLGFLCQTLSGKWKLSQGDEMPVLSARSKRELASCHEDIRRLFEAVAEDHAIEVICGHRGKLAQEEAFRLGRSKLQFPKSRHNSMPSEAADVLPREIFKGSTIDWGNAGAFHDLARVVKATALKLQIPIEHGGDWRMRDWPHWQLAK